MRIRSKRNRPPITAGPELVEPTPPRPDTTLLREELTHALIAESGDPVLIAKYAKAIDAGCPVPDLTGVPQYKRLQTVDAALDEFNALTAGGPCALCGTIRPRFGPSTTADDGPRFVSLTGDLRACNWCADFLSINGGPTGGQDHLREVIGNALMGTRGLPPGGSRYRYAGFKTLLPFAHEVPTEGTGAPWSHLTTSAHRLAELRKVAVQRFHPSRFCMTKGQADSVSVPGITTVVWDPADLPKHETKFIPISRKGRALSRENERAYLALKEERARREAQAEKRYARMRERDAQIEKDLAGLSDEDREFYLQERAAQYATHPNAI